MVDITGTGMETVDIVGNDSVGVDRVSEDEDGIDMIDKDETKQWEVVKGHIAYRTSPMEINEFDVAEL